MSIMNTETIENMKKIYVPLECPDVKRLFPLTEILYCCPISNLLFCIDSYPGVISL